MYSTNGADLGSDAHRSSVTRTEIRTGREPASTLGSMRTHYAAKQSWGGAVKYDELYIGGEWVAGSGGERLEVRSPATLDLVGEVPLATADDIDRAVAAARGRVRRRTLARADHPRAGRPPDAAGRPHSSRSPRGPRRARPARERHPGRLRVGEQLDPARRVLPRPGPRRRRRRAAAGPARRDRRRHRPPGTGRRRRRHHAVERAGDAGADEARPGAARRLPGRDQARARDAAECVARSPRRSPPSDLPPGVVSVVPGGRDLGEHLVGHPVSTTSRSRAAPVPASRSPRTCGRRRCAASTWSSAASPPRSCSTTSTSTRRCPRSPSSATSSTARPAPRCTRVLAPRVSYHDVLDGLEQIVSSYPVGDPLDREHVHRSARHRGTARAGRAVRLAGQGRGRAASCAVADGPRAPRGNAGLVRRTHTVRGRRQLHARRARGDLRAGGLVIPYETSMTPIAIANDSDLGLAGAVFAADENRAVRRRACSLAHRPRGHQHARHGLGPALRRLQAVGRRPGARPRRAGDLPGTAVHRPA